MESQVKQVKTLGYYNGRFDEIENMQVPMTDRGCYFGDGCYDATFSRNYIIYNIDEHIDRFFRSAGKLRIELPHSKEEMKNLLYEMLRKMDYGDCFIYWQATRGSGLRSHAFPTDGSKANIWIMIDKTQFVDINTTYKAITMPDTRFLHCDIKTLNLIPAIMAYQTALEKGCDEAILHRNGRVTECAHSNVHIIKNDTLITPPADNLILSGIARRHLMNAAKVLGYEVAEKEFYLEDLMNADEVIITCCDTFCIRTVEIDGKPVGGKNPEMLKKLQDYLMDDFLTKTDINNTDKGEIK